MASNRPTRIIRPAQKLNEDNIGSLQLESHRNFVKAAKDPRKPSSLTSPNAEPSIQGSVTLVNESMSESDKSRTMSTSAESRFIPSSDNNDDSEIRQVTEYQSNKRKKTIGMSTS